MFILVAGAVSAARWRSREAPTAWRRTSLRSVLRGSQSAHRFRALNRPGRSGIIATFSNDAAAAELYGAIQV